MSWIFISEWPWPLCAFPLSPGAVCCLYWHASNHLQQQMWSHSELKTIKILLILPLPCFPIVLSPSIHIVTAPIQVLASQCLTFCKFLRSHFAFQFYLLQFTLKVTLGIIFQKYKSCIIIIIFLIQTLSILVERGQ